MQVNINPTEQLLREMEQEENQEALADAFGLLEKLCQNILQNPEENKYRHIKTTVKTLLTRLFNIRKIPELLRQIGFQQIENEFVLHDDGFETLIENFNFIKWQYMLLQARLEGPQQYQRAQEIANQQRQIQRELEREEEEKKKILQQVKYDQQERKLIKEKDAKANQLQFGAKVKTCEQIGIKPNQGG